jgi:hypothetical protein
MRIDENGWRWVSIEWLMKHTVYSGDFGEPSGYSSPAHFWGTIIESKALDAGFLRVVESLQTLGWMRPINIEYEDYGYGPEISIVDGHHRLVAGILLAHDEVPLHIWSFEERHKSLPGCPTFYTHNDHTDEYSLLVEVL